jgi:septal ring factor EnvC (AmiA/AmiB activator)
MNKKLNVTKQSAGGLKEIREIIFGEALSNLQIQIDDLKTENKSLKDQLKIHENNISKSSALIDDLTNKNKNSDNEQKKTNEYIESIKNDFEEKIKELKLTKIGKNQIGQAFIEWGMKVKQDDHS